MNTTPQFRHDGISHAFHWGMALLIAWQLLKFFDRIDVPGGGHDLTAFGIQLAAEGAGREDADLAGCSNL